MSELVEGLAKVGLIIVYLITLLIPLAMLFVVIHFVLKYW